MGVADLYELIEVQQTASDAEIERAFTAKMRHWSKRASNAPERVDRQKAEAMLEQLGQVRKVLLDPVARRAYDAQRSGPAPPSRISPPPRKPDPSPKRPPAVSSTTALFGQRLVASLVDSVVSFFVLIVVGVVVGMVTVPAVGWLVGLIAWAAYYVLLEGGARGQTPGKRALGLRVVDADSGASIGYGRALVRLIGRWVSALCMYIGYLWMLWDDRNQAWHDKMANDLVVTTR
jgi:uncharacterized RDD family membrane protein YckC